MLSSRIPTFLVWDPEVCDSMCYRYRFLLPFEDFFLQSSLHVRRFCGDFYFYYVILDSIGVIVSMVRKLIEDNFWWNYILLGELMKWF